MSEESNDKLSGLSPSLAADELRPEGWREDLPFELLQGYIKGSLHAADQELVDSLRVDDPRVDQLIREMESTLAEIEPNPVFATQSDKQKTPWWQAPWLAGLTGAGAAAAALYAIVIVPQQKAAEEAQALARTLGVQTSELGTIKDRLTQQEKLVATKHDQFIAASKKANTTLAENAELKKKLDALRKEALDLQSRPVGGNLRGPLLDPGVAPMGVNPPVATPVMTAGQTLNLGGGKTLTSLAGKVVVASPASDDERLLFTSGEIVAKDAAANTDKAMPMAVPGMGGAQRGGSGGSTANKATTVTREMSPNGTTLKSPPTTFAWSAPGDAVSWKVDVNSDSGRVLTSEDLTKPTWTFESILEPGRSYTWTVTEKTRGGDSRLITGRFNVLSPARAAELQRSLAADPHALARMQTYVKFDLMNDAEKELDALSKLNPGSPIITKLRDSLRKRRS